MIKVLYAGPFDTFGAFKGGIHGVVNGFYNFYKSKHENLVQIIPFNTCTIRRSKKTQGRFSLNNIINSINIYKGLKAKIKSNQIDCIYYNSSCGLPLIKDLFVLSKIKKKCKTKVVIHIHFAEYSKILTKFKGYGLKMLKSFDHIVFLSLKTMESFIQSGLDEKKVSCVYNYHTFSFKKGAIIQKSSSINTDKLRLLFVGSLNKRKGILDLINALNRVKRDYVLNVCGEYTDNKTEALVRQMIGKNKRDSIIFRGFVSGNEKKDLFFSSDVFILPSYAEGLPLVLLEAMASGNYIITTNVGAIPEIIKEKNGVLFSPGDVNSLSDIIENIEAAVVAQSSYKNYVDSSNYSLECFYTKTMSIIKEVCAK